MKSNIPEFIITLLTDIGNGKKKVYCPYCHTEKMLYIDYGIPGQEECRCKNCNKKITLDSLRSDIEECKQHYEFKISSIIITDEMEKQIKEQKKHTLQIKASSRIYSLSTGSRISSGMIRKIMSDPTIK